MSETKGPPGPPTPAPRRPLPPVVSQRPTPPAGPPPVIAPQRPTPAVGQLPVVASQQPQPESGGLGAALGKGLAAGTGGLVRITGKIFGEAQKRSGAAVADFRARPEHSRWRAYALGCYGLIVAGTLVAQLYNSNPLDAYVRLQLVDLPNTTMLFVRNDSKHEWRDVRVTVNGVYAFNSPEVKRGQTMLLPVTKFGLVDSATGRTTPAPKTLVPKQLSIDCDRGHIDVELTP